MEWYNMTEEELRVHSIVLPPNAKGTRVHESDFSAETVSKFRARIQRDMMESPGRLYLVAPMLAEILLMPNVMPCNMRQHTMKPANGVSLVVFEEWRDEEGYIEHQEAFSSWPAMIEWMHKNGKVFYNPSKWYPDTYNATDYTWGEIDLHG